MKVLHLNTMLRGGGTDDQCIKIVAGLRALGVDAKIMGPAGRELCSQLQASQVPQIVSPPEGPLKVHFMKAVAREIRKNNYDIIHAHHGRDYWPTFFSVLLSLRRPKVVFTRHLAKSPRSLPSRFFFLKLCDRVIAVSEFTSQVMKEGFRDADSPEPERHYRPRLLGDISKITVIPCSIDTERFYPQPPSTKLLEEWGLSSEHFIFAVVGGYDHPRGKGQREYLKAAALIHEQIPSARFLIIGRGSLAETLKEDIQRLGLKGKAALTSYAQDMPAVMNSIDCLVHPSIGTEAFGLVLLEAFACGKPVIASALDGIPEAFEVVRRGELVPPEDIESLASAMKKIFKTKSSISESERKAMHAQVKAMASLPVMAYRTHQLYKQILNHA